MGLHLPSAAFVHPHTPLRDALTAEAAKRVLDLTAERGNYTPIGHVIDEKPLLMVLWLYWLQVVQPTIRYI